MFDAYWDIIRGWFFPVSVLYLECLLIINDLPIAVISWLCVVF